MKAAIQKIDKKCPAVFYPAGIKKGRGRGQGTPPFSAWHRKPLPQPIGKCWSIWRVGCIGKITARLPDESGETSVKNSFSFQNRTY